MQRNLKRYCIQWDRNDLKEIGAERHFTTEEFDGLVKKVMQHPAFLRLAHVMQMMPRIPIETFQAGVQSPAFAEVASLVSNLKPKTIKQQDKILDTLIRMAEKPAEENNRMTHSLEVMAVGSAIAKKLGITRAKKGEELRVIQLACLLHDVGHCPFGHEGEHAIKNALKNRGLSPDMIDHNRNGLVVAAEIGIPQIVGAALLYHDGVPLYYDKVKEKYDFRSLPYAYREIRVAEVEWPPVEFQIAAIADDIANAARDVIALLKASNDVREPGLSFEDLCAQSRIFVEKAKALLIKKFPKKEREIDTAFEEEKYSAILDALSDDMAKHYKDKSEPAVVRLTKHIVRHTRDGFIADVVACAEREELEQPVIRLSIEKQHEMDTLKALVKEQRDRLPERARIKQLVEEIFVAALDQPDSHFLGKKLAKALEAAQTERARAEIFISAFIKMTDGEAYEIYRKMGKSQMQGDDLLARVMRSIGVKHGKE